MNSHLGRFLTHADELLQECRGFGESLRASLEGELEKMHDTVAHGLDAAAQRTAEHAASRLGTALDTALGDRLAVLRRELDELGKLTQEAHRAQKAQQAQGAGTGRADGSAPLPGLPVMGTAVTPPGGLRTPWPRGLTALVASANLMLLALLVLVVLDLRGSGTAAGPGAAQAGATGQADAGPTNQNAPGTGAAGSQAGVGIAALPGATGSTGAAGTAGASAASWPALCQPLAQAADPAQAHAFVAAAAAATCGDHAGAVTTNVLAGVRAVPPAAGADPGKPAPGAAPADKAPDKANDKPGDASGSKPGAAPKRSRRSKPAE